MRHVELLNYMRYLAEILEIKVALAMHRTQNQNFFISFKASKRLFQFDGENLGVGRIQTGQVVTYFSIQDTNGIVSWETDFFNRFFPHLTLQKS